VLAGTAPDMSKICFAAGYRYEVTSVTISVRSYRSVFPSEDRIYQKC
jgi:hypothetical protein